MEIDQDFEGLTLLLREERSDGEYAVLESYSRRCSCSNEATRIAQEIGESRERSAATPTEYVGLADVFAVSGPATVGAVLGRTGIPEWRTVGDVLDGRRDCDVQTTREEDYEGTKNYLVELGFIERFPASEARGLAAKTLVRALSVEDAEVLGAEIATKVGFAETIVALGLHPNAGGLLEFVCVLSIARVCDDALSDGPFQDLVRPCDDGDEEEWSLYDELLHPDDLLAHFDESGDSVV
jgi:hypothetical protein